MKYALEKIYEFARSFDDISFISLPRKLLITGREAPLGGPSDMYYSPDAYLLYAEKTAQQLFPECEDGSRAIIDQLFHRAAERDDLILQIQALTAERDRLATDNAARLAAMDDERIVASVTRQTAISRRRTPAPSAW